MKTIDLTTIPAFVLEQNGINLNYFDFDATIEAETEKAYKVKATSDYGAKFFWVAKSLLDSDSDYGKKQVEIAEAKCQAFASGADKYAKLIAFAKQNGVAGVREKMKKQNVINKILQAGLQIPEELR